MDDNKMITLGQNSIMANFEKTDEILKDMCGIIESSHDAAYRAVNITLIQRNWLIGYRIAVEEIKGADHAEYGAGVIAKLAKKLTSEYGKALQNRTCIISTPFIRLIRRFSKRRLENLLHRFLGLIMPLYCR